MITLTIGNDSRQISTNADIEEGWINRQIMGRRKDGVPVCVRLEIHQNDLNIVLVTAGCRGSLGSGRPPNTDESAIFALWEKRGMNDPNFSGGNLVAFLHQLLKR